MLAGAIASFAVACGQLWGATSAALPAPPKNRPAAPAVQGAARLSAQPVSERLNQPVARQTPLIEPLPPPDSRAEVIMPVRPEMVSGISLDMVTRVALANSPLIREADNQFAAARFRALQASLYPNPTLGTASPQLAGNQTQYNAYVIQDYVTRGKIGLDTAAADRAAREAELSLVRARFEVLTMVRQRFFSALAAQRRVEVLSSMVEIARSALRVAQRTLEAEVGTKGNVLLLQIEFSKADAELRNALTLAETTKRQLAAATGLIDLPIDRIVGRLELPLPDYELMAVQRGVITRNAVAQSAEVEIARSQLVLRRAEVEPFPNLNLMGGYQNQLQGAHAPENQAIYQAQVVIPLWNRNQGNIRAAQASVGTAVAQLSRVRTELANDTANALGRYRTSQILAARYEQSILPAAQEVQRITLRLYQEGQVEFLLYLNAQRALLDANLAYINAQEARWLAASELAGLLQSDQFP